MGECSPDLSTQFHPYEGHSMASVVYPIRVLALLGVKNLISKLMLRAKLNHITKEANCTSADALFLNNSLLGSYQCCGWPEPQHSCRNNRCSS